MEIVSSLPQSLNPNTKNLNLASADVKPFSAGIPNARDSSAVRNSESSIADTRSADRPKNLFRLNLSESQLANYQKPPQSAAEQRSVSNQPPINQYQITQQILKKEELSGMLGVDLFA